MLKKIVKDLKAIRANLGEIPTLIIDDEADQASINTTDPRKDTAERRERTAINKLLAELLRELPRAQYIGYTATPFANVFVDLTMRRTCSPRTSSSASSALFAAVHWRLGSRSRPHPDEPATKDPSVSNQAAYVRDLTAGADDEDADGSRSVTHSIRTCSVAH